MRAGRVARTVGLITLGCLALLVLSAVVPAPAHASAGTLLAIPGWLQDAIDSLMTTIVKTLQDTARLGGVLFWGILKLCGMVALFAQDFSALFGNVITEALNAIMAGSVHQVIRGSLMVSLGLFGSFVRGEQNPASDIDILVEFSPDKHTFDNFMDVSFVLEDLLGRKVDVVTPEALSPYIGPYILKEVQRVAIAA